MTTSTGACAQMPRRGSRRYMSREEGTWRRRWQTILGRPARGYSRPGPGSGRRPSMAQHHDQVQRQQRRWRTAYSEARAGAAAVPSLAR